MLKWLLWAAIIGAGAVLAVVLMGVLGWPLEVAAGVALVVLLPVVLVVRFGSWLKQLLESAAGMKN